jgi:hypothetical protein
MAKRAINHSEDFKCSFDSLVLLCLLDGLEGAQSEDLQPDHEDVVSADHSHPGGG